MCITLLHRHEGRSQSSRAFRVFDAIGPVAYRPSAKVSWKEINGRNSNPVLYANYEVKLSNQSILILEPAGHTPIVIWGKAGIDQVRMLVQPANRPGKDEVAIVLGNYFKSLWRNLTHDHETIDSYAQGYMKQKGVISRGCSPPLMLTPDYGAILTSDTSLFFVWKRDPSVQRYSLSLYDNYDTKANLLYSTETNDTTLLFPLNKPFIKKEKTYYWSVFPVGDPNCARYSFRLATSDTLRELQAKVATLESKLRGSVALTAFVKAALYEEKHFFSEAYQAYFQAHRLSPTNPLFSNGFALFLARRGLTEQVKSLGVVIN